MSELNAGTLEIPKPKAILKLVEEDKSSFSDSGLASDSKNVTFSPATKVVEFSPLTACSTNATDKSICITNSASDDLESEEITLDISVEEGATNGPLQSSALAGGNMNIADMSTIHHGEPFQKEFLFSIFSELFWSNLFLFNFSFVYIEFVTRDTLCTTSQK